MKSLYQKHKKKIIAGAILLLVFIFLNSSKSEIEETTPTETVQTVEVFDAATLASTTQYIEANGTVETLEEVTLSSEVSARIARVHVDLGDTVYAGQSLVVFSNADLAANLAGAVADLEGAKAVKKNIEAQYSAKEIAIEKTYNVGNEAVIAAEIAVEASENTEETQVVRDAYADMVTLIQATQDGLDVVLTSVDSILGIDNIFADNDFEAVFSIQDTAKKEEAIVLYAIAKQHKEIVDITNETLSVVSDINAIDIAIVQIDEALESFRKLLLTTTEALAATPAIGDLTLTELTVLKSSIQNARASISSYRTNITNQSQIITTAKTQNDSAVRDLEIARQNLASDLASGNAQLDQIASQQALQDAQIRSAQARVASIQASLAKTVVRTPISGTVATLPAKVGELMNPGTLVVRVVNTAAYQVKTYIAAEDVPLISDGNVAKVANTYTGVVTNISPSIDPTTNKVEVIILVTSDDALLVSDQFVSTVIERTPVETVANIRIPLESVRLTSKGATVLVVTDSGILEERHITIGQVVGSEIEADISNIVLPIVSSVRGLEAGEQVVISE